MQEDFDRAVAEKKKVVVRDGYARVFTRGRTNVQWATRLVKRIADRPIDPFGEYDDEGRDMTYTAPKTFADTEVVTASMLMTERDKLRERDREAMRPYWAEAARVARDRERMAGPERNRANFNEPAAPEPTLGELEQEARDAFRAGGRRQKGPDRTVKTRPLGPRPRAISFEDE
tara:strand:+ start:1871 stop:2392 length:522 start_codon:yes stop_codon:yes gene_type:complete